MNGTSKKISSVIKIAAAVIFNSAGNILLVRKKGTSAFMQPGGKIENHESPATALVRELSEELLINIGEEQFVYIGRYQDKAVNEEDSVVNAEMFMIHIEQPVTCAAEIAEIRWVNPSKIDNIYLAPLTKNHIIPVVKKLLLNGFENKKS